MLTETGPTRMSIVSTIAISICIWTPSWNVAYAQSIDSTDKVCRQLEDLAIQSVDPLSATPVHTGGDESSEQIIVQTADGIVPLPDYCRVRGKIHPEIRFELRLPLTEWNGKFFMAGCGGFCGQLMANRPGYSNSINVALARGYAAVTTDSGHGGTSGVDGIWAYNDRQAEIDWAYRSIPEVARAAKTIIQSFYGTKEKQSYFSGCSNGGRMGAIATQRYPDLFDGVIIGAPALDWRTLSLFSVSTWNANTDSNGDLILDYKKLGFLSKAVMKSCDAVDGLKDGQIDDPRKCSFDPSVLQCTDTQNTNQCLTSDEVGTVKKWYAGLDETFGPDWKFRIPQGSEQYWRRWYAPAPGQMAASNAFSAGLLKYIMMEKDKGPEFDPRDFDINKYPSELEYMRQLVRADNPDLTAFQKAGGKAIMYQGWEDPAAIPEMTIGYYEDMRKTMGGQENTDKFFKLFMVPGAGHCFERPRNIPDLFDPIVALEKWVEQGVAPESILAKLVDNKGETKRSRPLCPYPLVAKHKGVGSIDEANNFECKSVK